jgi:deazaflavin-dependent oxidoreductase (nitroreductase family)
MSKSLIEKPPRGALRLGLRLPIWLYRVHLGWLLGNRFLMLTHTGRKSGLPRQAVVEVVEHEEATDTYYVVSGWGEKADWYQNIRKSPQVTIHVSGRRFQTKAKFIPQDEALDILGAYARNHPTAFSELSGLFLGERLEPGSDAPTKIAKMMPMVAFHPQARE